MSDSPPQPSNPHERPDRSKAQANESRDQKVAAIAAAASLLPHDQRQPFLDRHCQEDTHLRHDVQKRIEQQRPAGIVEGKDWPSTMTAYSGTPLQPSSRIPQSPFAAAGHQFGKFTILGHLGRGGMGVVSLAFDSQLKRKVALKVLPDTFSSDERAIKRFVREAEAAARLRHRNIIPIYAAGEIDGTYYYSMEYVPGMTLGDIIRELRSLRFTQKGTLSMVRVQENGDQVLKLVKETSHAANRDLDGVRVITLPIRNYVREAVRLFTEVAGALDYAHREGIVHRDIKPSNMILAPDGRLMIGDFGLAKIGGDKSITQTGDLMGSPSYMSPEQTMGRRTVVDHRTDIWSLGLTLYEFLTLHHPFESDRVELTLKNILTSEPRSPRKINPRLPKDAETILLKAIDKDPDRRYETAQDFEDDLESFLNYEAIQARSAGPITRTFRFARRNSSRLALTLLSAALILVAGFSYYSIQNQGRRELSLHFDYIRERMLSRRDAILTEEAITSLQEELLAQVEVSGTLSAAIDVIGVREIEQVGQHLEGRGRVDYLDRAMESLAKVRLIYHHNPNAFERDRLAKIDRAHADIRIGLVWEIQEVLEQGRLDPFRSQMLWEWLRIFLGNREWFLDMREENVLVRINAIEAMRRVDPQKLALELRLLLSGSRIDSVLAREAILAITAEPHAEVDLETLDLLASLAGQRRGQLDFLSRHRLVSILSQAKPLSRFRDALLLLQSDPEPSVSEIATNALAELDQEEG